MKRNQKLILCAAAFLLLTAAAAVTYGYLTSKQEAVNTFTVGDLDLGLQEPEWEPESGDGANMVPGSSAYKNPTVKNITSAQNGEEPCYVRMIIRITDENGTLLTDGEAIKLIRSAIRYDASYTGTYEKKGTADTLKEGRIPGYSTEELAQFPMINPLFTVDEERSEGGKIVCAYMGADQTGILKIGEEATLFCMLAIPTDWTAEEIDIVGDFRIEIAAEAIQATGFASQAAAYTALDTAAEEKT